MHPSARCRGAQASSRTAALEMTVLWPHQRGAPAWWALWRGGHISNSKLHQLPARAMPGHRSPWSATNLPALWGPVGLAGQFGQHCLSACGQLRWAIDLHRDSWPPRPSHPDPATAWMLHRMHLELTASTCRTTPQLVVMCHSSVLHSHSGGVTWRLNLPQNSKAALGKCLLLNKTEEGKVPTEVLHKCYFSPCVMYAAELGVFFRLK